MGVEENNRNEILSRMAADIFAKSKGGEELSSKIHRLRDEIKKMTVSEPAPINPSCFKNSLKRNGGLKSPTTAKNKKTPILPRSVST